MKKIYILAAIMVAFTFTGTSQIIEDDFEFYTLGDMAEQNPFVWTGWTNDGGATPGEGMVVTDVQGNPGQAGAVVNTGQDAVLLLGNLTTGDYTLSWDMYIPSGKSGYFNIQGEIPPFGTALSGVWNSGDIYFNEANGNPGMVEDKGNAGVMMSFPHDAWFTYSIYVDMDGATPTYTVSVDGVTGATLDFATDTTLGGIDFFFAAGTDEMYVDNVSFVNGAVLGTQSFEETGFRSAINNDILTLRANEAISNVSIYNMLGQEVYNSSTNTSEINMSSYANGTYIVKVNINGTEGSVKVIK